MSYVTVLLQVALFTFLLMCTAASEEQFLHSGAHVTVVTSGFDPGPVATRPPEDDIEGDDEDDLDETLMERLWGLTEMFPDTLRSAAEVSAQCSLSLAKKVYGFSRTALWIGTTSFMILVLPVVFETERLQLEQQQLQQQRQILLGPNAGMSGVMPGMAPLTSGKV